MQTQITKAFNFRDILELGIDLNEFGKEDLEWIEEVNLTDYQYSDYTVLLHLKNLKKLNLKNAKGGDVSFRVLTCGSQIVEEIVSVGHEG